MRFYKDMGYSYSKNNLTSVSMQKKLTDEQLLGSQGTALIDQVVSQIGFAWRPTVQHDVGIDGEIEIRDTTSGWMTGLIIKVQSKAVTAFQNETADGFDFWCKERDVQYWLSHNVPVILIVSRPSSNELYWLSVRQHVADSSAVGRFRFVKSRDRLDRSARARLIEIVQPGYADAVAPVAGKPRLPDHGEARSTIPVSDNVAQLDDHASAIRYSDNRNLIGIWGWKVFLAFVAVFGGCTAVLLPLMLKSGLITHEVDFTATRIAPLLSSGAIPKENIYTLSFILSVPNATMLWFMGHLLANPVAAGIRHTWSAVDAALYRRIVCMCILLFAFILAGNYFWLFFPNVSYWQALGLPLLVFLAALARAKSE